MAEAEFPAAEELRQHFKYDPVTGAVTRPASTRKVGCRVRGILVVEHKGLQLGLHRIVWAIHYGKPPPSELGFVDGDGCNLAIDNLKPSKELRAKARLVLGPDNVREVLDYDPESGHLTWKIDRRSGAQAGERADVCSGDGYWLITFDGKQYLSHRVAWLHQHGKWPDHDIDHIDNNGHNNAAKNLRDVRRMHNLQNRAGAQKNSKSGCRGVTYTEGLTRPWRATAWLGRKPHYEHHYTLLDAAAAVMRLRRELMTHSKEATNC